MDLIYDELLLRQRLDPAPVKWQDVTGPLITNGVPEEQLRQAVDEWVRIGLMTIDVTADTLGMKPEWLAERLEADRRAVQDAPPWVGGAEASPPPVDGPGLSQGGIALLAICGGSGLDRLVMGEIVRAFEGRLTLVRSGFAEIDDGLGRAVSATWASLAQEQGGIGHERVTGDAWDLVRGASAPICGFVRGLPTGCLLLIIAGTPCQDLTYAGPLKGLLGLCGPVSVLFYSVPVVAWIAQVTRPDVYVHVVLENAASSMARHQQGMREALGLPSTGHTRVISTEPWSHAPRERLFLSTLPLVREPARPRRRLSPWDVEFALRYDGIPVPFMRARGYEPELRASTYQYHPRHLLYRVDSHWHFGTLVDITARLRRLLNAAQSNGLSLVLNGNWRHCEREALEYVRWVEAHGREHGLRVANVAERVRSTGRERYLRRLGLTDRELFDLVGNHFDPDALIVCLLGPLEAWARGERHRHEYPSPRQILTGFAGLRQWVRGQTEADMARHPFPGDLREYLVMASVREAERRLTAGSGRGV